MILEGILWRMVRVNFCRLKIDENVVTYNTIVGNFCFVIVIIYLDNRTNLPFMYEKCNETVVIWNFTSPYSKLETFCIHFHLIWTNICILIGNFQVRLLSRDLRGYLVKNIFMHFLSTKIIYEIQSYMIRILICWFSTD